MAALIGAGAIQGIGSGFMQGVYNKREERLIKERRQWQEAMAGTMFGQAMEMQNNKNEANANLQLQAHQQQLERKRTNNLTAGALNNNARLQSSYTVSSVKPPQEAQKTNLPYDPYDSDSSYGTISHRSFNYDVPHEDIDARQGSYGHDIPEAPEPSTSKGLNRGKGIRRNKMPREPRERVPAAVPNSNDGSDYSLFDNLLSSLIECAAPYWNLQMQQDVSKNYFVLPQRELPPEQTAGTLKCATLEHFLEHSPISRCNRIKVITTGCVKGFQESVKKGIMICCTIEGYSSTGYIRIIPEQNFDCECPKANQTQITTNFSGFTIRCFRE
jgi:hypothetical protein